MSLLRYLNEGKFEFLPTITINNKEINWNINKSESKFLSQLNNRVTANHITDSNKLGEILQRGITRAYNECVGGFGRDNDTCLRFTRSSFTVIFNKDEHSIIGIRKPIDKLNCNRQKTIFENCEGLEEFARTHLGLDYINMGEVYDGIRFDFIGETTESVQASLVCRKCVDIDL